MDAQSNDTATLVAKEACPHVSERLNALGLPQSKMHAGRRRIAMDVAPQYDGCAASPAHIDTSAGQHVTAFSKSVVSYRHRTPACACAPYWSRAAISTLAQNRLHCASSPASQYRIARSAFSLTAVWSRSTSLARARRASFALMPRICLAPFARVSDAVPSCHRHNTSSRVPDGRCAVDGPPSYDRIGMSSWFQIHLDGRNIAFYVVQNATRCFLVLQHLLGIPQCNRAVQAETITFEVADNVIRHVRRERIMHHRHLNPTSPSIQPTHRPSDAQRVRAASAGRWLPAPPAQIGR